MKMDRELETSDKKKLYEEIKYNGRANQFRKMVLEKWWGRQLEYKRENYRAL